MTFHFSDSERHSETLRLKAKIDQCWRLREILDNTYLRSLFILGYLPDKANTELSLLKSEGK